MRTRLALSCALIDSKSDTKNTENRIAQSRPPDSGPPIAAQTKKNTDIQHVVVLIGKFALNKMLHRDVQIPTSFV
jgi:hypothetical protein